MTPPQSFRKLLLIDIYDDETQYSIVYKCSVNLNDEDGRIHKNYNSLIQNLNQDIQVI